MSRLPPPPCLSLDLPLTDKTPDSELTPTRLGFPNEFPYEFDSPAFSPGFTSPGNSTETEDESSDDEEDFLAGLTRRLAPSTQRLPPPSKSEEKRQVAVTSPQSTLTGLGSRSPVIPPSHAHTASFKRDNAWDVISAAAGEVARLKLGSYEPHLPRQSPSLIHRRQNAAFQTERFIQQQRLIDQMWLCSQRRTENHLAKRLVNEELAFENLRIMRRNASSNATWIPQQAVTQQKRPSTGTGVFIPRRYPTTPSENIKKSAPVNKTAMLQSKVSREFTNVGARLSQFDYECMLARSALLARQGNFRAVGCLNQERRLPQDWMY
ncbi:hypothetical protein Bca4012_035317 [Brassica carinata]|uniref:Uncharacterized protein n=1 Tax=Brassica carinata TaxID=52824 RepID=A0A8X8B9I0_BRACI|nr:hypothetical protein Bca52824_009076 [Brassica carinata]